MATNHKYTLEEFANQYGWDLSKAQEKIEHFLELMDLNKNDPKLQEEFIQVILGFHNQPFQKPEKLTANPSLKGISFAQHNVPATESISDPVAGDDYNEDMPALDYGSENESNLR